MGREGGGSRNPGDALRLANDDGGILSVVGESSVAFQLANFARNAIDTKSDKLNVVVVVVGRASLIVTRTENTALLHCV